MKAKPTKSAANTTVINLWLHRGKTGSCPKSSSEVLKVQNQRRVRIGEALVRLKHLSAEELVRQLRRFKAEEERFADVRELPGYLKEIASQNSAGLWAGFGGLPRYRLKYPALHQARSIQFKNHSFRINPPDTVSESH